MFKFDITLEDGRLLADSETGESYDCVSIDQHSGKSFKFTATPKQLSAIITIASDMGGLPENYDELYALVEPLFTDAPNECRFIP